MLGHICPQLLLLPKADSSNAYPVFPHLIHFVPNATSCRQPSLIAPTHSTLPPLTPPFSPTHLPARTLLIIP